MMGYYIRHAQLNDVAEIKRIARQYPDELGFVSNIEINRALNQNALHVAVFGKYVIGYALFYRRRDGWNTIYSLSVDKTASQHGVGRNLLYSVPCPIRLKCPVDNDANTFYKNAGMALINTVDGKKRKLNVYELQNLYIFCAGSNNRFPEIARKSSMAYGTRHDYKPHDYPFMVDVKWNNYDWRDYMQKIYEWRPVQAMVPDYEHPNQRQQLYQKIRDLREAGVMRIKVCPKFNGAVKHIPTWCIVAISIPSKYAGYIPPLHELKNRKMHMLGGSPVQQKKWITRLNSVGRVISLDGNSHTKTASQGGYWRDGKWNFDREKFDYYDLIELSGRNIQREMCNINIFNQPQLL